MLFRAVGNELSHAESIILLTANFGLMFNMKNSSALGGSFHFVGDDNGTRVGIGPRYRKWLSPKTVLDISPRILFGGDDNHGHRSLGYSLAASLSLSDLMSFDSYYQILP